MCGTPVRDRSNIIFMTGIVAGTVALASVSVRTLSAIIQNSFGLDDVFALAAEAACLPVTVIQCVTPRLGFGKDTWVVPQQNIYKVLRLTYGSQISYFICHGLTKLAFLFFFLRIFPSVATRRLIRIAIFVSVLYTVGFASTMTFACRPISALWTSWDGTRKPDYCINQNTFYLIAAAINICLDIAIVLIPIPELIKLNLNLRKKVFLIAIFGVGAITIVVSCIRVSVVVKYATSSNPMYDNLMSGVYSVLEINVGIVCVSMPAFPKFLVLLVPKCFGSKKNDSEPEFGNDVVSNPRFPPKPTRRKKSTRNSSLFNSTMMKTMDLRAESGSRDDEVNLVGLQKGRE
ncbi:Actin cytoskeleton-regulatory complex protein [Venturia nashicola]|nr:Actin cytoskeleton-regulatory complex protein [Venturia nashicola]